MNKLKLVSIVAIGLLLSNISLLVFFYMNKPHHPPRHDGPRDVIIERMHFDAEQINQYDALIKVHRTTISSKEEEMMASKNNLYQQLLLKNNETAVDSLLSNLSALHQQIETIHYRHFEDIHQLCHPEQEKYFQALTSEIAQLFSRNKMKPPVK